MDVVSFSGLASADGTGHGPAPDGEGSDEPLSLLSACGIAVGF